MIEELRIGSLGRDRLLRPSSSDPGSRWSPARPAPARPWSSPALGLLLGGRADSGAVRSGARRRGSRACVGADRHRRRVASPAASRRPAARSRTSRVCWPATSPPRAGPGRSSAGRGAGRALAERRRAAGRRARPVRPAPAAAAARAARRCSTASAATGAQRPLARYRDLLRPAARRRDASSTRCVATARERAREADLLRFGLERDRGASPRSRARTSRWPPRRPRLGYADTLRAAAEQAREALSERAGRRPTRSALPGRGPQAARRRPRARRRGQASWPTGSAEVGLPAVRRRRRPGVATRAGLDADPARLAAVSERRAALTALTRKYGDSIDEVLAWAEQSAAPAPASSTATDERIERAPRADALARAGRRAAACRRPAPRPRAARRAVTAELGCWRCRRPGRGVAARAGAGPTPHAAARSSGGRPVALRLPARGRRGRRCCWPPTPAAELRPLHKGASGGELSRVMLADRGGRWPAQPGAHVRLRRGRRRRGRRGRGRGRPPARSSWPSTAQVIVVTHLAQVAAFADRHVVVDEVRRRLGHQLGG